jgi:hypothetical protein
MPKLYEYLGIVVKFFSNEHFPIHVHAFYKECEMKIEIIVKNKEIEKIIFLPIKGKKEFSSSKLKQLKKLIEHEKYEIVTKWIRFFVYNERVKSEKLNSKDLL